MPPSKQVEVDMEDGLSGVRPRIRHNAVSRLCDTLVMRDPDASLYQPAQETGVGSGEIRYRRKMPAWNHEHMNGSLWIDILECYNVIILIHRLGRNSPGRDSAE